MVIRYGRLRLSNEENRDAETGRRRRVHCKMEDRKERASTLSSNRVVLHDLRLHPDMAVTTLTSCIGTRLFAFHPSSGCNGQLGRCLQQGSVDRNSNVQFGVSRTRPSFEASQPTLAMHANGNKILQARRPISIEGRLPDPQLFQWNNKIRIDVS